MWVDANGRWTRNPVSTKTVYVKAEPRECTDCDGEGSVEYPSFGKVKCKICDGLGTLLMPAWTDDAAENELADIYYRQWEIQDFKRRCEIEEEKRGI